MDDPVPEAAGTGTGRRWRVVLEAKIRSGFEQTSADRGMLEFGRVIEELESRVNEIGVTRVRFDRGWVSERTAGGDLILEAV